ncbi:hypothetical protein KBD45_08325 [Candidatus Dojkabacteria bacterium]|nr:hypothetical protein [Candidatus Dojkabacteria bacterium]
MGIIRIYPEKNNTIASGIYKNFNSGQNAVTDLFFGGGGTDTAPEKRNSYSRFIVKFDISDLQNKIASVDVNTGLTISYKLKMKNSVPKDKLLEAEYEYDVLNKNIAASFDLICFPINKDWDEGRGYDMSKEKYLVKQQGNPLSTGYSNWNSATSTTNWDEPGVFTDPSTAVTYYAAQHFDLGSEDIDMDITQIVCDWLSGGSQNNGIAIAYRRDFELLSTDTRYISSFFTNHTNTAFKPFIEVSYNQSFKDDRNDVTNNRQVKLFLYTFSGNSPVNFYSASTVSIKTSAGADVYTGLTPTQVERGVYYVNVWMSAATRGQQYKDVWNNVTFNPGYDQQNYAQTFTIQDNFYFNNSSNVNNYSISTYGLDNNSIINTDEIIRVYADLRINFSTNPPKNHYELQYRVLMNHQDSVIPWTSMNQAMLNKCMTNYFTLDTSWLLQNQTYEVQFRIGELGTLRTMPEKIKFRVLRDF